MEIIGLNSGSNQQAIAKAIVVLKAGGLVVYPTETCYGIGVDATNAQAVEKILQYKTKRADKPLSIAVCDAKMASEYCHINKTAQNIYQNMLPGPITVVSKGKSKVAVGVESPHNTVGVRIPDYTFVLNLISEFGYPITATSANASYKKTPYTLQDILDHTSLKQQKLISLMLDAGELPKRKPSVVVDTLLDDFKVLRSGDIELQNYQSLEVKTESETENFSSLIYKKIQPYLGKKLVVLLLQGDLGTGKTFFTRSLGSQLGVMGVVSSPTYILCREHKIPQYKNKLYHIDTYRMVEVTELEDLRPQEIFQQPNIVVIEWADRIFDSITEYLSEAIVVKIRLEHMDDERRKIYYIVEVGM